MNRQERRRRPWIAVLPPLLSLVIAGQCVCAASRPNVILILTDDQGYGDMSCTGNPVLKTPEIDRLYSESVRFTDFHVDPMCAPTRAALMTGRYAARVGVWRTFMGRSLLRKDELTMADIFRANGYRTAIFGKWHLGDAYPFRPHDRGFDEAFVHGGGVVGEVPDYWGNDYYDDTYFRNGRPEKTEGYCTDVWFREAEKFIERNRDKPFFVYLPTNAAHGPLNVPRRYSLPYLKQGVPAGRAAFYGMIASIDENLGHLRERLRQWGLAKNTILIFLGDNGTATGVDLQPVGNQRAADGIPVRGYNAGMRGKKTSVYDGGHRVACFLHWPGGGLAKGRDVTELTAHIDLLPTLIDLCGLKPPKHRPFDGKSLVPLLRDPQADWPDRTLVVQNQQVDPPRKWKDFAVMTRRWRLVGDELYDIKADPGQRRDVAAENPLVVQRLRAAYQTWWESVSRSFNQTARFIVGSDFQNPVRLDCQSWFGQRPMYNQQHVRAGLVANGYWEIEVARAGLYEITLRRWPEELGVAINDAPEWSPPTDASRFQVDWPLYKLPTGKLQIRSAQLKIGTKEWEQPVRGSERFVRFVVHLAAGPTRLQTWLVDKEGKSRGAYYVYVRRLQ